MKTITPRAALFQDATGEFVVLDLPTSIQEAQDSTLTLVSCTPLTHPWPSTEPKGMKLQASLAATPQDVLDRDMARELDIASALARLRSISLVGKGLWCLPRCQGNSSLRNSDQVIIWNGLSRLSEHTPYVDCIPLVLSSLLGGNVLAHLNENQSGPIINPYSSTVTLRNGGNAYHIPPRSSFILSTIERGTPTFRSAMALLNVKFDLILMDPPWANRSVRRGKAYNTTEAQSQDPFERSLPLVRDYLKVSGFAAVWITNKTAIREHVIAYLARIDLQLHVEWVWTKVTVHGEAVFPLDGIWRKPYECLLIFTRNNSQVKPRRRYIFCVPDFHSRKPSLKQFFEDMLPPSYQALELFARNLTAGWWSWGDEVLKFQHVNQWSAAMPAGARGD